MAETDELYWRETYFVLFPQGRRPALREVSAALTKLSSRYQLANPSIDQGGLLESILVESPEDHAALEISYEFGEAIGEQAVNWAKQLRQQLTAEQLQLLLKADARLAVAHFERVQTGGEFGGLASDDDFGEEDDFDMLDPTCLLTVVGALAKLTGGLTLDPAAGEILS